MKITVNDHLSGKTVKEILFSELGLSRGQVVSLKNNNGIRVDTVSVTVRHTLNKGEVLELDLEDREEDVNPGIEAVYHELDILYEDDDIICINKSSGMATHPSHNHHGDTLANALVYYFKEKNIPFVFRAVNRLDRETSGVVLVAKNRTASSKLSSALQRGEFVKKYYAVVEGTPEAEIGVIENYIVRREDSIIFRKSVEKGSASEYSRTEYEIVECYDGYTLLRVTPITGRTHQIRVHMSGMGHPIYGDGLYGTEMDEGLMLHAYSLDFPLPSGKRMTIEVPLPDRFEIFRRNNEI